MSDGIDLKRAYAESGLGEELEQLDRAGLDWHWTEDDYRALLTTTGGRERIARYMVESDLPSDIALIAALHTRKNRIYTEQVAAGALRLRPGILRLIGGARERGIRLAIATTTSRANLTALLAGAFAADASTWFEAIVAGEDVSNKKPDPEVYRRVLDLLALNPTSCVAIEDTRNGLDAALGAGLSALITPSHYSAHEWHRETDPLTEIGPLAVQTLEDLH